MLPIYIQYTYFLDGSASVRVQVIKFMELKFPAMLQPLKTLALHRAVLLFIL